MMSRLTIVLAAVLLFGGVATNLASTTDTVQTVEAKKNKKDRKDKRETRKERKSGQTFSYIKGCGPGSWPSPTIWR